jgi:hypothetical protein
MPIPLKRCLRSGGRSPPRRKNRTRKFKRTYDLTTCVPLVRRTRRRISRTLTVESTR